MKSQLFFKFFLTLVLFAIEADLEQLWEPSWLILGRFGLQNGIQNSLKFGPKSSPKFDQLLDRFWKRFGLHFGIKFGAKIKSKFDPNFGPKFGGHTPAKRGPKLRFLLQVWV